MSGADVYFGRHVAILSVSGKGKKDTIPRCLGVQPVSFACQSIGNKYILNILLISQRGPKKTELAIRLTKTKGSRKGLFHILL